MMHNDIVVGIMNNTSKCAGSDDQYCGVIAGAILQAMGDRCASAPTGSIARPKDGLSLLNEDKLTR